MRLSYELATEFLSFLRVPVDSEEGALNLLCLQGMRPSAGGFVEPVANEPGKYNDTIALVGRVPPENDDGDAIGTVDCLLGTVDPGSYYTKNPLNARGAAHLTFGQHLYVKGHHNGHPALRALNETNRVWRDKNGNFKPDRGEAVYTGEYSVNIHAGGRTEYINKWSAGCINVWGGWDGPYYEKFLDRVDLHAQSRTAVRVTLWSGQTFMEFLHKGWSARPTLVLGTLNGWVAEMQRKLANAGHSTSIDGDFGTGTHECLIGFQQAAQLDADGVCGPDTWAALVASES